MIDEIYFDPLSNCLFVDVASSCFTKKEDPIELSARSEVFLAYVVEAGMCP